MMVEELNNKVKIAAQKAEPWFMYSATVALIGALIVIAVMHLYPFKPMEFYKVELSQATVRQGCVLTYTVHLNKFTNRPGTRVRQLESPGPYTRIYGLSSIIGNLESGAKQVITDVVIPDYVLPGKYRLKTTVVYEYPLWRDVRVTYYTDWFTVLAEKVPCE